MDAHVNPLERDHRLSVVLPGGLERNATVHGSKPVMDLLVTLCASYHLNPSDYTVEVLSPNKNNISFKPNSPIGSLEADKIVLKPKGAEEKTRRLYMPEASVRLLINYNKSHKAVVRVSPRVPLESLLPVVCDKCEFKVETTVLLRDSRSSELLDMSKSLSEHGLREVFAKDTAAAEPADQEVQAKTPDAAVSPTEVLSPSPLQDLPRSEKKQKRSTGFLSLFRRVKKKTQMEVEVRAPVSPGFNGQVASSSNTLLADMPKKRRAPPPPVGASQSVPSDLGAGHLRGPQMSAESTLRSTKRRAPPPPCANGNQEPQPEVKGTVDSLNAVEELRESDEADSLSPASSPCPSQPWSSSSRPLFTHFHEMADPYLLSFQGKDLSDARSALAKVLTSSVSKGALVRRLRNSATLPKLHTGSPFMSTTPRCSGNVQNWAEPEPVSTFDLPSEPEWDDPGQRRGMTTFQVVPSKKSHDPELTLDDPDQINEEGDPEGEGSPQLWTNQTETEEDPCSPERPQTENPLQSPEEVQDSPFDFGDQVCPDSPLSQAGTTQQKEEDEPELPSEVAPAAPSDCSDGEPPSDGPINSEDQRKLLQSPSRQPETTDMDHCGSNTDEKEVEEEVVQKEEEKVEEKVVQEEKEEEVEEKVVQEEEEEVEEKVVQEEEEEVEEKVVQEEEVQEKVVQEEEEEVEEKVVQEEEVQEKVVQEVEEEEEVEEDSFPPPPSPVFFDEDAEVTEAGMEVMAASSLTSSQPPSPSSDGQTGALGEDHQSASAGPEQPAAAPQPLAQMNAAPSRFAQAVALAVQRSRLQGHGKGSDPQAPSGPHSALPSPHVSIYQFGA